MANAKLINKARSAVVAANLLLLDILVEDGNTENGMEVFLLNSINDIIMPHLTKDMFDGMEKALQDFAAKVEGENPEC